MNSTEDSKRWTYFCYLTPLVIYANVGTPSDIMIGPRGHQEASYVFAGPLAEKDFVREEYVEPLLLSKKARPFDSTQMGKRDNRYIVDIIARAIDIFSNVGALGPSLRLLFDTSSLQISRTYLPMYCSK
jgi:hypothetical protein